MGEDKVVFYIYSDYLKKNMRFPKFTIKNNEILYFNDVFIPCTNEVIVSMATALTFDAFEVHNTVRINCNRASLGTTEKVFRFYPVKMFQEDPKQTWFQAISEDMAKSTTTIFRSFVQNSVGYFVKKVSKAAMLKDFKNAALFSVV